MAVVDDPEAVKFLSGEAICVTTMNILVNGRIRFGLSMPGMRQPITMGSIVIDDVHAALASAEEKTRLHIPRGHPAYERLVDLFTEELKSQDLNGFLGIETADPSAVVPVPFWGWQDKHETVMKTLADDSVLVTHFDADPEGVGKSIVPESAADFGDRLVLAPQELNPDIGHEQVRALAHQIAKTHNVVVLVPSHPKSREWAAEANLTGVGRAPRRRPRAAAAGTGSSRSG
ncbi:hypothetical protein KBX37_20785 [Micromonospora sp. U56]|nr:hypothetical protein [Micromonospora sp. U56]MBQ0895506.1 hypothetical protein [Micromonospora sp. U56]